VHLEAQQMNAEKEQRRFTEILLLMSWKDRALFTVATPHGEQLE